jgi:hypothetical protein
MGVTHDPSPPLPGIRSPSPIDTADAEKASLLPYYTYTDDERATSAGAGAFDESHRTLRVGSGRDHHRHRHCRRAKSAFRAGWSKFGWAIKTLLVVAALWIASHALFRRGRGDWPGCGGRLRPHGQGPVSAQLKYGTAYECRADMQPDAEPAPVAPLYTTSRVHDTLDGLYVASNTSFPLGEAGELVLEVPPEFERAGDETPLYISRSGSENGMGELIVEYMMPLEADTTVSTTPEDIAALFSDGETAILQLIVGFQNHMSRTPAQLTCSLARVPSMRSTSSSPPNPTSTAMNRTLAL